MSVSAVNIDEAAKAVSKAWLLVLKECQSRACDDELERVKLHRLLKGLERLKIDFIDFETSTFGFEFWKPIEKERKQRQMKRRSNFHCAQMGIPIPYPEEETPSSMEEADNV